MLDSEQEVLQELYPWDYQESKAVECQRFSWINVGEQSQSVSTRAVQRVLSALSKHAKMGHD